MRKLNCLILDDDELDRLMIISFIKKIERLNIVAVCAKSEEALKAVEDNEIDVLFLDIDMPGMNGLAFRKATMHIPVCIYVSAHPEFAVDSFELDTLDFLVKPLKFDRFLQAVTRIEDYFELKEKVGLFEATIGGDDIFIKDGHQQVKIKLHAVLYLEALKDYTKIVTSEKSFCVLTSLGNLLKQNSFENFIRVHRSYATQKHKVIAVDSNTVKLDNHFQIPVGRSYRDNLAELLL